MTEVEPSAPEARSAGSMLRAARERQGLHIAALAAAIKVPQAKLEALEAGRYDELSDATFVRALAHSVCRVLKIDAKPVLELLPAVHSALLERVDHGLRAPFQERPGTQKPSDVRLWHRPVFWLVTLLLLAAAAFLLWPQRATFWNTLPPLPSFGDSDTVRPPAAKAPMVATPTPAASAPAPVVAAAPPVAIPAPEPTPAASGVVSETVHAADAGATVADAPPPASIAVVRASEPSWVEARDARGAVLVSRTLQPGEVVGLDGALPLRLVIGNASATEVTLRGKRVTLGAPNRDNVVRVELK